MKKIKLTIIIIMLFFTMISPMINSSGITYQIENFDTYGAGVSSGSNTYVDWDNTNNDDMITDIAQAQSGSLSLRYRADGGKYDTYLQLKEKKNFTIFDFWFYAENNGWGSESVLSESYIKIYDESEEEVIHFHFDLGSNRIRVEGITGEVNLMTSMSDHENEWLNVGVQINRTATNPINYIYYFVKNETGVLLAQTEHDSFFADEKETFECDNITLHFYPGSLSTPNRMFFDSFNLSTTTLEGGAGEGVFDGYSYIGSGCSGISLDLPNKYMELVYDIPLDITIVGLETFFDTSQSNIESLTCCINGNALGTPTETETSGSCRIARWYGFELEIDDETIIYEYYSPSKVDANNYFKPSVLINGDSDGDGIGYIQTHNTDSNYCNGGYNGNIYVDGIGNTYDLCYKIYYVFGDATGGTGGDSLDEENDHISFNGEGYLGLHPTLDIPSFYTNTSVIITYSVQTILNTNTMHIYDYNYNEVGQTQGYPKTLGLASSTVSFVPYNNNTFYVTIERGGEEVANESFYAYWNSNDYQIWSIPSITNPTGSYQIHYIYGNSDYNGLLGVFGSKSKANDIENAYDTFYVESDSQGAEIFNWDITFTSQTPKAHYWRLFADIDGTYIPASSIHTHYLRVDAQNNYINVDDVTLGENGQGTAQIEYEHSYVGGTVSLYVNNKEIANIGNSYSGTYDYKVSALGLYNASMRVFLNGSWYTVDFDTFVVKPYGSDEGGNFYLPVLSQPMGSIVGLIIFSFCAFLPYLLAGALNKRTGGNIQPPTVLYGIFSALGLGIAILMGCFPVWLVYFVVASGIIAVFLVWLIGKQKQGVL